MDYGVQRLREYKNRKSLVWKWIDIADSSLGISSATMNNFNFSHFRLSQSDVVKSNLYMGADKV